MGRLNMFVGVVGPGPMFAAAQYLVLPRYFYSTTLTTSTRYSLYFYSTQSLREGSSVGGGLHECLRSNQVEKAGGTFQWRGLGSVQ